MLETTATKLRKNLPKEIEPCFKAMRRCTLNSAMVTTS